MKKKRILIVNDAHYMMGSYSKIGKEFLTYLQSTGKYELAELASYGQIQREDKNCGWRYYANSPSQPSSVYDSDNMNTFGKWRLERVCLDFRPDIVFATRDPYMDSFLTNSPLKEFYHLILDPPIESVPQIQNFLNVYSKADTLLTYTDFGKEYLERCGMKVERLLPPGVNSNVFKNFGDKESLKQQIGCNKNWNIIGTVMRNQPRKLFPELFDGFKKFLDICWEKDPELAKNTFLFCHTSVPDQGWDFQQLLKESGIANKILITYSCEKCKSCFISFFKGVNAICSTCQTISATTCNTNNGVLDNNMALLYNIMDIYVQYSNSEGLGLTIVEAASCEVPFMSIDYSAPSYLIKQLDGISIKPDRLFKDVGTMSDRALPNNDDFAQKLYDTISLPEYFRRKRGKSSRNGVIKYYSYDVINKRLEEIFDNVKLSGNQGKWEEVKLTLKEPPEYRDFNTKEDFISNSEYISFLIKEVMQEPSLLNSHYELVLNKDLNLGFRFNGRDKVYISRETLYQEAMRYYRFKKDCEEARTGVSDLEEQDYIAYANLKYNLIKK